MKCGTYSLEIKKIIFFLNLKIEMERSFLSCSSSLCSNPGTCAHRAAQNRMDLVFLQCREKFEMWHLVSGRRTNRIRKSSFMNIVLVVPS